MQGERQEGCHVLNGSNFKKEGFYIYGDLIIQRDKIKAGKGNQRENSRDTLRNQVIWEKEGIIQSVVFY